MRHIIPTLMKICSCCGSELLATEDYFHKKKSTKSGLAAHCKKCHNKKNKDYAKKNPEKIKLIQSKYKNEKRAEYLEMRRRSHLKNKSTEREYQIKNKHKAMFYTAKWREKVGRREQDRINDNIRYKANPTSKRMASSRWQKLNPEKKSAINHKRRAILKNILTHFTASEWQDLKEMYNNTCLCCGRSEPDIVITKDHVIPLSLGGSNDIKNIQPLCFSCNSSKGNRSTKDYRPCAI